MTDEDLKTSEKSDADHADPSTQEDDVTSPRGGGVEAPEAQSAASVRSRLTERALDLVQDVIRTYQNVRHKMWELGDLLLEAKASLSHGEFLPWVEEIGLTRRTAQRCMQLRKRVEKRQLASFTSVNAALEAHPAAGGNDQVGSGPQTAGSDAGTERRSAVASDSAEATESPDTAPLSPTRTEPDGTDGTSAAVPEAEGPEDRRGCRSVCVG